MKNKYKVLLLTLCAVLLIASAAFGTIAYLTDSETVTNTFTVGQVGITLDEAKVTTAGVKDGDTRVKANEYHLIPGHSYIKDPIVHVDANSENCWLFVEIDNQIAAIEGGDTVAAQMSVNKWELVEGEANVYAYNAVAEAGKDYPVFERFEIAGESVDNDTIAAYADKTIVVTAYAVKKDGFDTAEAAWDATFGKPTT